VLEAMGWALLGASSLLIGAGLAFVAPMSKQVLGFILAFGAGVLISAVAYELVEEAVGFGAAPWVVGGAFALGALVFAGGDFVIEKRLKGGGSQPGGLGIVLGAVLDGIPESVVIGASLINEDSASIAVVVAVFLSNIPEAVAASSDILREGWSRGKVFLMWVIVVAASTIAAGLGYAALKGASADWISAIQAFSAGAILTMLADEMIPEAFDYTDHNKTVGVALAFGFAVSAALSFRT
jgi:zinc transporter, ZIP family